LGDMQCGGRSADPAVIDDGHHELEMPQIHRFSL
jgi:hypothetical protein